MSVLMMDRFHVITPWWLITVLFKCPPCHQSALGFNWGCKGAEDFQKLSKGI